MTINLVSKTISRLYNEELESFCTKILYFFNTIDTYFLFAGICSFVIVFPGKASVVALILSLLFAVIIAKIADFYPSFIIFAIPIVIALGIALNLQIASLALLFFVDCVLFFLIQFIFMGIPDSIVARDMRVAFIKMYNSLFTVAPTTVSFSMSVFFSFYLSFCVVAATSCQTAKDYTWLGSAGVALFAGALITRSMHPKNRFSKFHKPDIREKPLFKRVVILNIDGVRKDIFDSLSLPTINRLKKEGTSHSIGLESVYRALTNPAFASILTGTIPKVHGIHHNFGQSIRTEGLPDIVPSIVYGSMHVKHFCKRYWQTRIVSLPRHSVYLCDDIMVGWLKDDMLTRPETRLFIADFSEADFLAHAYGSKSKQYRKALQRIDRRIGDFIDWMQVSGMSEDAAVIVCSDHGIAAIDHSYLIADSEKYVPFLMYGKGIKKNFQIQRPGKIMDICCTVSYLLGVRYPYDSRGQVFTEALENSDLESEKEAFVSRFNQLKYDAEAKQYHCDHVEIYDGDAQWWDERISQFATGGKRGLRILDIGCGNGFVGERFLALGANFTEFVCMDISENILKVAKKALGAPHPGLSFTTNLDDVQGVFDIITVNSLFHHVVHPEKLARTIDRFLIEGGIVMGSHEPNKEVFKNKLFYAGAALYKRIGGGISIDEKIVQEFNRLLRNRYPNTSTVCREEILQMVEYHSPLEQYERGIDLQTGFVPEEFCKSYFPGYEVGVLETYSTFFHRRWLSRHKILQFWMAALYKTFFREGNLFRFVLKKV